jgi:hypothetical protein
MFKKYMLKSNEIRALNISLKDKMLAILASFIISSIIFTGPIVLFSNLLIYYDLNWLFNSLFFASIVAMFFITEIFYYKGITKGQIDNLHHVYLIDSILYLIAIIFYTIIHLV